MCCAPWTSSHCHEARVSCVSAHCRSADILLCMQAALKEGVRSTLAALLEAPASSMEVAVRARNVSSASLITSSGSAGTGLQVVASYDISVIISPPVRSLLCSSSCFFYNTLSALHVSSSSALKGRRASALRSPKVDWSCHEVQDCSQARAAACRRLIRRAWRATRQHLQGERWAAWSR